jgi:hypothetical protein
MFQKKGNKLRFRRIVCSLVVFTILATGTVSVFAQTVINKEKAESLGPAMVQPVSRVLDRSAAKIHIFPADEKGNPGPIRRESMAGWEDIKTEDFEGAFPNDWQIDGDPMWDDESCMSYTGDWGGWCADGGTAPPASCTEYVPSMLTWMVYGPFDLSDPGITAAELMFMCWQEIESYFDVFMWLASTNGNNFYGYQSSGSTGDWVERELDLTDVYTLGNLIGQSQVWIAFIFSSDESVQYEGVYLDDIVIRKYTGVQQPCIRVEPESIELTCNGEDQVRSNVRPNRVTGQIDEKYIIDRLTDKNGKEIVAIEVPGKPPEGYRAAAAVPLPDAITLPDMPAYDWSFGCSATSAAMIAAHFDRNGFPNIYTGPTNGGVMPLDNSVWGSQIINGEDRSFCPLSATANGVDGRTTRGHVNDYWIQYLDPGPDPWITNGWAEHPWGDCTGDYMGTNQSSLGNSDGSTTFYFYTDGSPLYDFTYIEPYGKDGCAGFRDFYESRGYTVLENYSQYLLGLGSNPSLGFTFDNYMAEIDAGYPVLIQVEGHTMVGYGYDEATQNVYIHDTWDYSDHLMSWGGYYEGLFHYGVCVVHPAGVEPPSFDYFTVYNDCAGDLIVSSISSDQPWCTPTGFPALPFTLGEGENQVLNVDMDWSQIPAGSSDLAVITIASNDPDDPTVDVFVDATNVDCGNCSIYAAVGCDSYCEGSEISVPITVDMSLMPSPDDKLGSYTATLYWDPTQLEYTGHSGGSTSGWGSPTVNTTNVATGQLDFSAAKPTGSSGLVNILNMNFDIIGGLGDPGTVDLGFTAMASATTFTNLMPYLCVEDCDYEIESCGILGDVNGDDLVNSTDALIILSCDVGLDVSSFCPMNCGDVNGDGLVNSTDALIVLAYDVGQSVPFPVGEPGCPGGVTPCPGCTP